MAARSFFILALLVVAVVGQAPDSSPEASSPFAVVSSPDTIASSPDTIGAIGDDGDAASPGGDAIEAPIGGPVAASVYVPVDARTSAEAPADSSASMIKLSAAGLTLAVAGYLF